MKLFSRKRKGKDVYRSSLKQLAQEFLRTPVNFVTESDLKIRLVEILRRRLKNDKCKIGNPEINKPNSYKKKYWREIEEKIKENPGISRVHAEVSVEKNKRFDIAVFKPKEIILHFREEGLAGGSKRFEEKDLEAIIEIKFVKNNYYFGKEEDYLNIFPRIEDFQNLDKVDRKFLVIFSHFNFLFKDPCEMERKRGPIYKRSKKAREELHKRTTKRDLEILYIYPGMVKAGDLKDLDYSSLKI